VLTGAISLDGIQGQLLDEVGPVDASPAPIDSRG